MRACVKLEEVFVCTLHDGSWSIVLHYAQGPTGVQLSYSAFKSCAFVESTVHHRSNNYGLETQTIRFH